MAFSSWRVSHSSVSLWFEADVVSTGSSGLSPASSNQESEKTRARIDEGLGRRS
jgi:hypothetical protein